jgi:hypothetical protein
MGYLILNICKSTEATTVACMDPKGNMTKIANSDKGSQM